MTIVVALVIAVIAATIKGGKTGEKQNEKEDLMATRGSPLLNDDCDDSLSLFVLIIRKETPTPKHVPDDCM